MQGKGEEGQASQARTFQPGAGVCVWLWGGGGGCLQRGLLGGHGGGAVICSHACGGERCSRAKLEAMLLLIDAHPSPLTHNSMHRFGALG